MPFKCNYSGTQAIDLRWHMTMHSGEKRHMFLHSGGKHFKCMQCNYSDTIADNLKKHILVHSGEKPLMCKQCNNVYTWSIHLKRRSRHCIIIFLPIGWMLPVLSLDKVNMARSNHIFSASVDWTKNVRNSLFQIDGCKSIHAWLLRLMSCESTLIGSDY